MGRWQRAEPLTGVAVPGEGPIPAKVMLVGDRPGRSDPAAGRPFTGIVGKELERYLKLAGLHREEVYATNIVKDWLDDDPTEDEVARDLPELLDEIDRVQPELIVPMGRVAIRFFLGDVDVERVHGILHITPEWGAVYPTFHPAAGVFSGDSVPALHYDFIGLSPDLIWDRLLPDDAHPRPMYHEGGPFDRLYPISPIAIDTEGYHNDPWFAQWSQSEGNGVLVDVGRPEILRNFQSQMGDYVAGGGTVYVHNSLHDLAVTEAIGIDLVGLDSDGGNSGGSPIPPFVDTMVLSYLLAAPPQALKSLAYRLCGMVMDDYEEVVGVARRELQEEWLAQAVAVADLIPEPDLELVWDDAKSNWKTKQPQGVGKRLKRLQGDLLKPKPPVIAERVGQWTDSAAAVLVELVGPVPEPTLHDIPRRDALRYSCRDADATLRIAPILRRMVSDSGLDEVSRIDHAILPMVNRMQQTGWLIDKPHFEALDEELTGRMEATRDVIGTMVGIRINPSSPKQVADLLFKQLGLDSLKTTKGGADSTQDKVLESLRTSHPVVPLILDYRELDKARGSFCRVMPRMAGDDGRIHCNLRVTRTASGRLAANTPNLMAIPVRSDIGLRIREGFVAAPGFVIAGWDLDQIEMRHIADLSQDPFMMELFHDGGRDIHKETAARMFEIEVGQVAKLQRYAAKRVGFGIATQITGHGLVDQMALAGAKHEDGTDWTEDECDELIVKWYKVYRGVRRWIDTTKSEVRRTGQVRDRWGRLRHLEGVWSCLERIREETLRQGPSHKIQAGAQGHMKKIMAAVWHRIKDEGEWVRPLLQIHDALDFEVRIDLLPELDGIVTDCMENTVKLSVPTTCSGEWGWNWGQMTDIEEG